MNDVVLQPAMKETRRGPRSRAGLKHACVRGATPATNDPTTKPIMGGTKPSFIVLFFEFVKENTVNANNAVPIISLKTTVLAVTGSLQFME